MATTRKRPRTLRRTDAITPEAQIGQAIFVIRDQRILLDSELAALYGVTTKRFNEQVRRNLNRFPPDFMFQLSEREVAALRSQIATLKSGRGQHRKYLPYAFTEHGAIMAAMILNSARAVEMSVYVVRAFVRMREMIRSNETFAKRLDELEAHVARKFAKHDETIGGILSALRELLHPPVPKKRPIGFIELEEKKPSS